MTGTQIAILAVQGVAFLVWAGVFFRALFAIRGCAAARTGRTFPGPIAFLSAGTDYLRDPATRRLRIVWIAAFAVMVACIALSVARLPA
ncbi:hypothetical protein HKCCE2091_01395 [Rhodobacterales bacterium HKCCE2091]|nr:hypothetical protein [Rhodobacterales bacterium HKCCE2091]